MIKPDQAPDQDESAGPHPPAKEDLDFLQRCFEDSMSGAIENWPVATFKQYFATFRRFADLFGLNGQMPAPKLSYGERLAGMAILELSKKISLTAKGRKMDQLVTGLKH